MSTWNYKFTWKGIITENVRIDCIFLVQNDILYQYSSSIIIKISLKTQKKKKHSESQYHQNLMSKFENNYINYVADGTGFYQKKEKKPMQISALFITFYLALGNKFACRGIHICSATNSVFQLTLNRPTRRQAMISASHQS